MEQSKIKNYRWVVIVLLFFASTINYLDRQVIGLLKPTLELEFGWTEKDYGHLIMAFSASYAIGLLLFGKVIDRIGTKLGYVVSVVVWSGAAMFNGLAKTTAGFLVSRAVLGLGESGNFPAAIKAVAEWFPKKERALATGVFNSGANIGAVVAPVMVPWLLGSYGWQEAFYITGALGFIWLIFWIIFYEIPSKQKRITIEEYNFIHSDAPNDDSALHEPVKWSALLSLRQTWAFIVGKFLTDPVWWFFLYWLPSYFSSTFKLDLTKPSMPLVIIYTSTTIGSIGGGYLSSYFIQKGWPIYKARKVAMFIFAICVLPIISARYATNMWMVVGLISLAAAAHQAWSANIFTTASDMFPKRAVSSVVGMGGMAGAVGGILFPFIAGAVLEHYKGIGNIVAGYNILFAFCGFAYIMAWLAMHFLIPKMKVVEL